MDRKFVLSALGYAIIGMLLGIYMAKSKDHGQFVTHAHILLAGFVVSFVYGLCHKLWLTNGESRLAGIQFYVHQVGVAVMSVGLFLLYGQFVDPEVIDPVLALSALMVLVGMVLMKVLVIQSMRSERDGHGSL